MTPSPAQTAQDLRQAAANVRTYGYATHEYVDLKGRVCALGAIGLATGYFQRLQLPNEGWDFGYTRSVSRELNERTDAAANALAPLLPTACEDGRCEDDPATAVAMHSRNERNLRQRVYHYNDFICEGGDELATLFVQAAEKIEADLP